MLRAIVLIAGFAAAAATANPQSPSVSASDRPITPAEFQRAAAQLPKASSDPFHVDPDASALAGREFELVLTPRLYSASLCDAGVTWRYNSDESRLELMLTFGTYMRDDLRRPGGTVFEGLGDRADVQRYLTVSCTRNALPSYRAANTFGASAIISRTNQRVIALTGDGRQMGALMLTMLPTLLSWSGQMSPADARALLPNLAVRVRLHVEEWRPGRTMVCGRIAGRPNMTDTRDDSVQGCFFYANFQSYEVIDLKSGKKLGDLVE